MSQRLSNATLNELPGDVARPRYDRGASGIGIVHLGVGAFHKAHQAVYTDDALAAAGGDWAIAGVSLKRPEARDRLAPQDYLYTVAECDNNGSRPRVIGALKTMLVAPENPKAVLELMARAATRVITLSITEKGYCLRPADGTLDFAHPDIAFDLAGNNTPRSAVGIIAGALALRRARGVPAPGIVSCDNLPNNGVRLRNAVLGFLRARDADLADWCARHVAFPSTMVDRIVPATTDLDIDALQRGLGVHDAACVKTEPFRQWIIEDRFTQPRPAWEAGGARFVKDVAPFEQAKLRLLNGAHSAIAYLSCLGGQAYVHDAMRDPLLSGFIRDLMELELAPTLPRNDEPDLPNYMKSLRQRFNNAALQHATAQIAMDGSQKLPPRLLAPIRERLAAGLPINRLALIVAAWMRGTLEHDERGRALVFSDPLASRIRAAVKAVSGPDQMARSLLRIREIFGDDLPADPRFVGAVLNGLSRLMRHGVAATLRAFATQQ